MTSRRKGDREYKSKMSEMEFECQVPGADFSRLHGGRGYTFYQPATVVRSPEQVIRQNTAESQYLIDDWIDYEARNETAALHYDQVEYRADRQFEKWNERWAILKGKPQPSRVGKKVCKQGHYKPMSGSCLVCKRRRQREYTQAKRAKSSG